MAAPANRQRKPVAGDAGAHPGQGLSHSPHGSGPETVVAVEADLYRVAGDRAHEQPHSRAGVAAVDDAVGLAQAALTRHEPCAVS